MKRFVIFFISLAVFLLLPMSASSQDFDSEKYNNQLAHYDFDSFEGTLDKDTYGILEDLGILDYSIDSITSLSFSDAVDVVKRIIGNKLRLPFKTGITIMVLILLSAFLQSINNEKAEALYSTASALIISTVILARLTDSVSMASMAMSVSANFIYAFIPVFCAIVVASGGVTTAMSTNTTLLLLSQGLSFISTNMFMPVINCYLALGVSSSLRYELNLDKLLISIKKFITTCISFIAGVFVSILSVKTAVAGRADALGLRSIRFTINSIVPVIGSSISEGLLSIQAYSSLVKSSVGVVGIIAVCLVFLPAILDITMWRISLGICSVVSDVFGDKSVSSVLNAFSNGLVLINVILILSMVTTIISIGVLVAAGGR